MANDNKLGTFIGVFTPTILTILGVIMYLRFGWLVGHLGLIRIVFVVVLANAITFITTLCLLGGGDQRQGRGRWRLFHHLPQPGARTRRRHRRTAVSLADLFRDPLLLRPRRVVPDRVAEPAADAGDAGGRDRGRGAGRHRGRARPQGPGRSDGLCGAVADCARHRGLCQILGCGRRSPSADRRDRLLGRFRGLLSGCHRRDGGARACQGTSATRASRFPSVPSPRSRRVSSCTC